MRLVRQRGRLAWLGLTALALGAAPHVAQARHAPSEAKLREKIGRENNPVKKAKLEIELGHLKLEQAAAAFDHDRAVKGTKLLDAYLDCMRTAWNLLQDSGRNPAKKPQGFTNLDIALRENSRFLFDLQQRTPYEEGAPIARAKKQSDSLHNQVLAALFPGGKLGPRRAKRAKSAPAGSALAPAEPPR